MHAWFRALVSRLFEVHVNAEQVITTNVNVRKALQIIHTENTGDLSLESLSSRLGVHRVYLCRLFKQEVGLSFYRYIQRRRVEKAKELLSGTSRRMYEVAREAGFKSYDQFAVSFKRATGLTPSEFRERNWTKTG